MTLVGLGPLKRTLTYARVFTNPFNIPVDRFGQGFKRDLSIIAVAQINVVEAAQPARDI